jgi:hypothetical protein
METSRCFLSLPYSGFELVRQSIVEALIREGVKPLLMEFLRPNISRGELVLDQMKTASFVIADVTGNNPSVLYEVGVAHGMQKPVLIITQNLESAPPILQADYLLLTYRLDDLDRLQSAVSKWAARFDSRNSKQT